MKYYAIHVLYQCTRRLIQAQFGTFVSVRNVGHQAVPVVGNTTDSPTKLMRSECVRSRATTISRSVADVRTILLATRPHFANIA
jgi:hypothetical protein